MNAPREYNKRWLELAVKDDKFKPPILNVFLERNGVEYNDIAAKRGRKRRAKQCYGNSTQLVLARPELRYVEGIVMAKDWPIGIDHAWAIDPDGKVVDVTVENPKNYSYFGVPMDIKFILKWINRQGYYGVFHGEMFVNVEPMLELDPELANDPRVDKKLIERMQEKAA